MATNKVVHVIGGGTRFHIDSHLYLGSKAMGNTARQIAELYQAHDQTMDVRLTLTNMADSASLVDTNEDMKRFVSGLVGNPTTKIVFFNPAIVDFDGSADELESGKSAGRLRTSDDAGTPQTYRLMLTPSEKIVQMIRKERKDIFLVAFKQTYGASQEEQYRQTQHTSARAPTWCSQTTASRRPT